MPIFKNQDPQPKAPKKYTYIDSETGRSVTMKKKGTLPSGKSYYAESFEKPKKRNYANPQRGAKTGTAVGNALRSVFGSGTKSTASGAKGMERLSSNPRRREKQIAEKRERGNSVCSPTSKSRKCGPNAK